MYFVKSIDEQNKILEKIKDIYLYDEIYLHKMPLYKKFKYICFFDEGEYIGNWDFLEYIYKICKNKKDDYLYICNPDNVDIKEFQKFDNKLFPSLNIQKEELKNSKKIISILDKPFESYSLYLCVSNTFIIPSSFEWLICLNRNYELGCFVSNNKNLNLLFKKLINENEFEKLLIAKLEII